MSLKVGLFWLWRRDQIYLVFFVWSFLTLLLTLLQKMQNVLALRGGEEEDASLPHGGGEEEEKQNVLALRIQCAVRSWLARQSAQNLAVERATALHHQGVLNIECVLYR